MARRTTFLLAAVLIVALQACTPTKITRGHHTDPVDLAKIQTGVTTQQQVAGILGSPSSVTTFRKDTDTWFYIQKKSEQYTELDESTVGQNVVAIEFDREGRVAKMKSYSLKDARDISFASRETPTQGAKLGLLEQMFGNLGVSQ